MQRRKGPGASGRNTPETGPGTSPGNGVTTNSFGSSKRLLHPSDWAPSQSEGCPLSFYKSAGVMIEGRRCAVVSIALMGSPLPRSRRDRTSVRTFERGRISSLFRAFQRRINLPIIGSMNWKPVILRHSVQPIGRVRDILMVANSASDASKRVKSAIESDRIMIWRFADAPAKLRALHARSGEPDWLVFVPRCVHSPDVDEEIARGATFVSRYDTAEGDIVYIGTASRSSASPRSRRDRTRVRTFERAGVPGLFRAFQQ